MIVVIPAYQPDEKLLKTVGEILEQTDYAVVVVDDGSAPERQTYFEQLPDSVTVLHHEVNRGKGAALKTAYAYIAEHYPAEEGIVTVDADGQHLTRDVIRVSEDWQAHPNALVLGSRRFTGKVPFKSMAGNTITRFVFRVSTGVKVYDTQTGLRAFSVALVPMMLEMKGDRYEHEINVLLYATRHRVPIREVPIDTVYIEDNASSHFHALRDGWRIYKMILLFAMSSIIAAVIDYVLVLGLNALFERVTLPPKLSALFLATVIARAVSSLCNYFINRKWVFENRSRGTIFRYYLLVLVIYALNLGLLTLGKLIMPLWLAKLLVELICYPLSFWCQRRFVFTEDSDLR